MRGAHGSDALVSDAAELVDDLDDRADFLDRVRDGAAVVCEDQRVDGSAVDVGICVNLGLHRCRGLEVHVREEAALWSMTRSVS